MISRLILIAIFLFGFGWVADLDYSFRDLNSAEKFASDVIKQVTAETGMSKKAVEAKISSPGGVGAGSASFELIARGRYYDSVKIQLLVGERVLSAEFGDQPLFGIKFLQSFIFFFIGLFGVMTISLKGNTDEDQKKGQA